MPKLWWALLVAVILALSALAFWLTRPSNEVRSAVPIAVPHAGAVGVRQLQSPPTPILTVHDQRLKPLINRTLPVSQRIQLDISSSIPFVFSEEDRKTLVCLLTDPSDSDTVRNEVASLLRRSAYADLTDVLILILDSPEEHARFRSFAVQHLWQGLDGANAETRSKIEAKLHSLLIDRHVEVRREALLALVRMRDPIGQEAATRWLGACNQEGEGTRDLAIRCVHELGLTEYVPVIRGYARDADETTRIAAIVALCQWGDEQSRAAFEEASKSPIVRIQRAGKAALDRLNNVPVQKR